MPDSVKIMGAVIFGATWLIVIRDHGHRVNQYTHEECLNSRMEINGDNYKTANRICKEIYQ
jgi:hypothetical protein